MGVGIEPLRAHVGAGPDVGVAGVEHPAHDLADSEIGDLHLHLSVHQKIRRFDVSVHDLVAMEVAEAVQNLNGDAGEIRLREGPFRFQERFQGSGVHVLHQNRDVTGWLLEDPVALDHIRRVRKPEDLHLPQHLPPDGRVAVAVDDLERIGRGGALVLDLVDGAAVPVADDFDLLKISGGGGGGGGAGGERKRRRRKRRKESRAALGDFRQWKTKVELPAVTDYCHMLANVRRWG